MKSAVDLDKLIDYMIKNNISKHRLSQILDISNATVSRIFKNQRSSSGKFLNSLIQSSIPQQAFLKDNLPNDNKKIGI